MFQQTRLIYKRQFVCMYVAKLDYLSLSVISRLIYYFFYYELIAFTGTSMLAGDVDCVNLCVQRNVNKRSGGAVFLINLQH